MKKKLWHMSINEGEHSQVNVIDQILNKLIENFPKLRIGMLI